MRMVTFLAKGEDFGRLSPICHNLGLGGGFYRLLAREAASGINRSRRRLAETLAIDRFASSQRIGPD
jgi:hypothetical protein